MSRFSLDEYTKEEVLKNGNQPYGAKRHDEILTYLKKCYDFDDYQLNDISMGIWLAIENQREVNRSEINSLQSQIAELKSENYNLKDQYKKVIEVNNEYVVRNVNLKNENTELKSELEKEKKVVDFYAKEKNWDDRIFLKTEDTESINSGDYVGGKLARQRQRGRKWKR